MSFHPDIAFALAKCSSLSDALHCMVNLGSQEAVYCAVALMHNLFIPDFDDTPRAHIVTLAASTVLNGSLKYGNAGEKESQTVVNILVGILKSLVNTTATPLLVGQLAVSTLCNLALLPSFHSQLSIHAMEPIITTLTSPRCNLDIKIDAVRFLYNLVTSASCFESKSLAIDAGAVPGILSILKLMTPEDNPTICLLGSILVEISSVGSLNQRMVQEGVSKAIIRLAKVEIPSVKQDIARAFFRLCLSPDGASRMLAMGDSVDALFWLTLHDCLGEFGPILSNVSRTLKNLSLTSEDCVLLANQDRLMNVLNVLSRCEKEDILWHTAAAIFNMLKVESIRHVLTKGGIVPIIFRLAGAGGGSGFVPVRFLCSASLHMIPG